jgi:hypothetical protein
MVSTVKYDLIPYPSETLPVPGGRSESLPARHDDLTAKFDDYLIHCVPCLSHCTTPVFRLTSIKSRHSEFTMAMHGPGPVNAVEKGRLIDFYA